MTTSTIRENFTTASATEGAWTMCLQDRAGCSARTNPPANGACSRVGDPASPAEDSAPTPNDLTPPASAAGGVPQAAPQSASGSGGTSQPEVSALRHAPESVGVNAPNPAHETAPGKISPTNGATMGKGRLTGADVRRTVQVAGFNYVCRGREWFRVGRATDGARAYWRTPGAEYRMDRRFWPFLDALASAENGRRVLLARLTARSEVMR